jgi:lipoprotein-anchoring transpeptidase ErfK/SrfK
MSAYSRREFLKLSVLGAGVLAFRPWEKWKFQLEEWPEAEKLGRNCTGGMINMRTRPTVNSDVVKPLYEDAVIVWLREVIGEAPSGLLSRRWVETPEGYVYAPNIQPVYYQPNTPVNSMPTSEEGAGMWAEVSVPYSDIYLESSPCSYWLKNIGRPRLYYNQVLWVDSMQTNSMGQILYRVNEKYGNCGDVYWVAAEAFRPITEDEIAPIHPEAEEKRIVVDTNHQILSCYEGSNEVYYCRISSGAKYDASGNVVDNWVTPLGSYRPWRKSISIHMGAGSSGAGYDTPGIGWTILFHQDGAAIHSTFWHNDFGVPRSHGCVNARPDDAKWIFRWSYPNVPYHPGDLSLNGVPGTVINVIEA